MFDSLVLFNLGCACVAAIVARNKNRNAVLWFAYGALTGPIALIHAIRAKHNFF